MKIIEFGFSNKILNMLLILCNPKLREKIYDSGHKWDSYVSEVWNVSKNQVIESHFGIIIEVYRNDEGKLCRVWKSE